MLNTLITLISTNLKCCLTSVQPLFKILMIPINPLITIIYIYKYYININAVYLYKFCWKLYIFMNNVYKYLIIYIYVLRNYDYLILNVI